MPLEDNAGALDNQNGFESQKSICRVFISYAVILLDWEWKVEERERERYNKIC